MYNYKICLLDLLPFCVLQSWYPVAKIISEEAALVYGQQTGLDVVTINPGLVFGPLLQPTVNTSSQFLIYLLKGMDVDDA